MSKCVLVIEVEEECVDCPKISLETISYGGIKLHKCEHLDFCKSVRENWEKVKGVNEECD